MIISYHGVECFKIAQGDLSLVLNPTSKLSADVTLFTSKSGLPIEASAKAGFVIDGPGEYENKDIFIKGFLSEAKDHLNTIYLITFEGMKLCFLGALSNPELKSETLEAIEDVDILFVPVNTLGPAAAYKLAVSLEPAIIIPMDFDKTTLEQFKKEGGVKNGDTMDKLVIKKKDLEGKEGDIIVLKEE